MSVNNETSISQRARPRKTLPAGGVYASLFDKINLTPVEIGELDGLKTIP